MTNYVAESTPSGVEVFVTDGEQDANRRPLQSEYTDFEWGYEGSGPRNLAYAILSDLIPDKFGREFMKEVIAKTSPIEQHERVVVFREDQILEWLRKKLEAG